MDSTVPKWVLINWLKIPRMPQNILAQFTCPRPKVWVFQKKLSLGVRSPCINLCMQFINTLSILRLIGIQNGGAWCLASPVSCELGNNKCGDRSENPGDVWQLQRDQVQRGL